MSTKIMIKESLRFLSSLIGKDVYVPVQAKINKVRCGSEYGGYVICPDNLDENSIVYSFGLGDDISFDLELIRAYGVDVFAYDPAPEVEEWLGTQELPIELRFYKVGLSVKEGVMKFYPSRNDRVNYSLMERTVEKGQIVEVPVKSLKTIMVENSHSHIDLLKIDIEGAEFEVLKDILESDIEIKQLLIEFHHKFKMFGSEGINKLKATLSDLEDAGYQIFDVTPGGVEYSFIKM